MGLFGKKKEEQLTGEPRGGKVDIQHAFGDDEIAYKFEVEDFYSYSTIFVKPGQEALVAIDEEVEVLHPGRVVLDTNNLNMDSLHNRILSFIDRHFHGGKNQQAHHCYVYFINKEKSVSVPFAITGMNVKIKASTWDDVLRRNTYHELHVELIARGKLILVVDNSMELLRSRIGQSESLTIHDVKELFRDRINSPIKGIIQGKARDLLHTGDGLVDIDDVESMISEITTEVTRRLKNDNEFGNVFNDEGFKLKGEVALDLDFRDEDQQQIKEWERRRAESASKFGEDYAAGNALEHQREMDRAQEMAARAPYIGNERQYDVLEAAAKNEGGARIGGGGGVNLMTSAMGMGMGVGLGQGMGSAMGNLASNAFNVGNNQPQAPTQQPQYMGVGAAPAAQETVRCQNCGSPNNASSKFCSSCGAELVKPVNDVCYCPACGTKNQKTSKFCCNCGNKLAND